MNNNEILEKAIQKAIDGGWLPYFAAFDKDMSKETILATYAEGSASVRFDVAIKGRVLGVSSYSMEIPSIIFNHDFAKALWGEEYKNWPLYKIKDYEFHLQQMVIAEDPIKYLGENI